MPTPPIYSSPALTYASDSAYIVETDPYDNSATKVQPSSGELTQGWRPHRQASAQGTNWVLNQFAAIMSQLITDGAAFDTRLTADEVELADHDSRIGVLEDTVNNHDPRLRVYSFIGGGTTTWVPNPRVVLALAIGIGAGGGGGCGQIATSVAVNDRWQAGAGGGGASILSTVPLIVVPGVSYAIQVGAGGLGATVAGNSGGDGADSIIYRVSDGLQFALFNGAQGGSGVAGPTMTGFFEQYCLGGMPNKFASVINIGTASVPQNIRYDDSATEWSTATIQLTMAAAQGGFGAGGSGATLLVIPVPTSGGGQRNTFGAFAGGAAGLASADFGAVRGGGGGGGGAAGAFGVGGIGGGGWTSTLFPPPNVSLDAPGTGTGAGGGGSGSNPYRVTLGDVTPFRGGNGSDGRVYIVTVERSP
jgi:hypothetical protein